MKNGLAYKIGFILAHAVAIAALIVALIVLATLVAVVAKLALIFLGWMF